MKIHYLQHVEFEDPANIIKWAETKNHKLSKTLLYNNEEFPETDSFDWLVIMGGPMNIYEFDKYPWLKPERKFIEKCINDNKIIIGICLGGQILADVLGAKVIRNEYKEIGWFPVKLTENGKSSDFFNILPEEFVSFHWHGDTFELPQGAVHIAESNACTNQAFQYNNRVFGLQFHIESSKQSISKLIENCGDELVNDKYIQSSDFILSADSHFENINVLLFDFLNNLYEKVK